MTRKFKHLIKECVIEVLQDSLLEGFDPQSQGPNVVDPTKDNNPYPALNSKMRTLEEEIPYQIQPTSKSTPNIEATELEWDSLVEYLSTAEYPMWGSFYKILGTYGISLEDSEKQNANFFVMVLRIARQYLPYFNKINGTNYIIPDIGDLKTQWMTTRNNIKDYDDETPMDENDHGRYAQESGVGEFDQRTFGKL